MKTMGFHVSFTAKRTAVPVAFRAGFQFLRRIRITVLNLVARIRRSAIKACIVVALPFVRKFVACLFDCAAFKANCNTPMIFCVILLRITIIMTDFDISTHLAAFRAHLRVAAVAV